MSCYRLENDIFEIDIHALGAEIRRFVHKKTGQQYIWGANPDFWAKSAPVLFPIVGELKEGTYTHKGKTYKMPKHGFARDHYFELIEQSSTAILFVLRTNSAIQQLYPFDFEFYIGYNLAEDGLKCTYRVCNLSEEMMYFSLGAHPAFVLPMEESTYPADYSLYFEQDEYLERYYIENGLLSLGSTRVELQKGYLGLDKQMFAMDAWVMKNLASRSVNLLHKKSESILSIHFEDFSNLGLWAVPGASFICIEPTCGYNDSTAAVGEIADKEGILSLAGFQNMVKTWSIQVNSK